MKGRGEEGEEVAMAVYYRAAEEKVNKEMGNLKRGEECRCWFQFERATVQMRGFFWKWK